MQETTLKKQFTERDLQRIRNLAQKKVNDKTVTSVGYTKAEEQHVEGDVWEEKGKTWTIRDGIKENVTKLDKFKKVAVPLFCPKCKQVMDKQLDPFYFKAYIECLDCRTKTETQMKLAGTWEDYTNQTFNAEIDQQIQEYKNWFENIERTINETYTIASVDSRSPERGSSHAGAGDYATAK